MKRAFVVFGAVAALSVSAFARGGDITYVLKESPDLPITVFNLTFRTGSADDPKGNEGIAALTAALLREGGVRKWGKLPARSRAEIEDFLFPLAADIRVSTGKEETSFAVTAAANDAGTVFGVLSQMLLAPAFSAEDFDRLKAEALDALTKSLPREDEEELGKAALDQAIYGASHPYGHVVLGTVAGVNAITLEKVKAFYASHFTRKRLTVGITGVIPKELRAKARSVFAKLPPGKTSRAVIPPAPPAKGVSLLIVKGPFDATGVHLGEPEPFTRASPDFPAMYLVATAFGKHRSFVGRLMHVVREERGLNYGAYSYVEDFPNGGELLTEPTQQARSRQAFTMWGRPAPVRNGCFLLRQMYYEVESLAKDGLTPEEFELGKSHLIGYVPLLGTGIERRLGYLIDSAFYGIHGDYLADLQHAIEKLTRDQVNATIKKYIHPETMRLVTVTSDAEKLQGEILSEKCEIHYPEGITKPEAVTKEDAKIAATKIPVTKDRVTIEPSEVVYEK